MKRIEKVTKLMNILVKHCEATVEISLKGTENAKRLRKSPERPTYSPQELWPVDLFPNEAMS